MSELIEIKESSLSIRQRIEMIKYFEDGCERRKIPRVIRDDNAIYIVGYGFAPIISNNRMLKKYLVLGMTRQFVYGKGDLGLTLRMTTNFMW
ncbi:hypothetical protein OU798_24300 [Prolixibacteraceae bacterium Z1-6]|uniref:Uncharacterized protein n=1 Tax=Draconibacterium aestuarii TaxID=2998507 RepID=A0A9X3JA85_9BACT|nr:hypothetical protein [Prolixibacteraceae bacterium Z1-6]